MAFISLSDEIPVLEEDDVEVDDTSGDITKEGGGGVARPEENPNSWAGVGETDKVADWACDCRMVGLSMGRRTDS